MTDPFLFSPFINPNLLHDLLMQLGLNEVPDIEEEVQTQQPPVSNGVVESLSVPVAVPQASSSTSTATPRKSPVVGRPRSASSSSVNSAGRPTGQSLAVDNAKERQRALIERMKAREKILYNDAVECPICFLVSFRSIRNYKTSNFSNTATPFFFASVLSLQYQSVKML